ncbi:chromosome partitioning protein ParA [Vibrio sp. WJH972]
MLRLKHLICVFPLLFLTACQIEGDEEQEEGSTEYVIQIGDVYIEMTEEIIEELESEDTFRGQLGIMYENFEPQLNRDDSYVGIDTLNNGIRDDIEAFIEGIQAEESAKSAMKQAARTLQDVLTIDYTQDDGRAIGYEKMNDISKVLACYGYLGIAGSDMYSFNIMLESLTYNTKNRMTRYMDFSKAISGGSFGNLDDKEEYCE